MEDLKKQEEMFPEIAQKAEKDPISARRGRHKKISDLVAGRKLGRYSAAKTKEQKALELQKIRRKILESDPA